MNGDDLRLALAGASDAACAVCLHMTFNRIVVGDGHVPICSTFCLQAWPRVRDLLADRDEWRRQHENALASWQADMRVLKAKQDAGLAALATRLDLFLPADFDPYYTIGLDIGRLQNIEHQWSQACDIARAHCPVDIGLSHVRDGIPALAKRAESAELGCEIAYRREPTQAEGDAHEYRHDQSMGASEAIRECHVPMGNHHGYRCPCGLWVWGGPTVCRRCVDAEAVKIALEWKAEADRLRLCADTDAKAKAAWEMLYNERNRLWREEADRVGAVKLLLEANGCDCDCEHHHDEHGADCDRCLACRVSWAIET